MSIFSYKYSFRGLLSHHKIIAHPKTKKKQKNRAMSRLNSVNNWQTGETAPPRLLQVVRRNASFEKLETIEEETEGGHLHSRIEKTPTYGSVSKAGYTKQLSSVRAA